MFTQVAFKGFNLKKYIIMLSTLIIRVDCLSDRGVNRKPLCLSQNRLVVLRNQG